MRVLITGAGLIGCHAARELIDRGDEVTIFDLAPRLDYVQRVAGPDVRVVRGDIRELPGVIEAVQGARAEAVFHTAAIISGVAQDVVYRGFQTNIGGTLNVAEAVRLLGVQRLVHASTIGVYDLSQPQAGPLTEEFSVGKADRVYPASKVACEQILRSYAVAYGFELLMLRFGATYGYGHFVGGAGAGLAVFDLLLAALKGEHAPIGNQIGEAEELVYVKDVAAGVAQAIHTEPLRDRVYNMGSGTLTTPESLVETLKRVVPGTTASRSEPPRPGRHRRQFAMDHTRSRADLGYEPRFTLEAGLRDLAEELRKDGIGAGTATVPLAAG